MVATSRGDCVKLKDLVSQEDATAMVVVMASSKQQASEERPSQIMNQCLLEAACEGNINALRDLLPEGHAQTMLHLKGVTAEGNTALHVLAANGDGQDFEACANHVNARDRNLLFAENKNGDTPLHCAARAGRLGMVSHLISIAKQRSGDRIELELLRKENGHMETALHEAVRIGDHGIVLKLLKADPELARFPEDGTSPLYLAILLKLDTIVETLIDKSKDNDLSFSGPNGQTALHAAVLRGPELTKKLLQWNAQLHKDLTAKKDEKGSTPLHFAAGLPVYFAAGLPVCFSAGLLKAVQNLESVCWQVFRDNTDALYEPDIDGLFPIHVAASVGAVQTVAMFVEKCGQSAGLRDAKGRTFLHVAAEKNKLCIVRYASRSPALAWITNMRDNDGNTAMHLAVQAGNLLTFSALLGCRPVNLNLPNAKGQTPRDIAQYKVPPRLSFDLNSDSLIRHSLNMANASSRVCRGDHFRRDYEDVHRNSEYEIKELGMLRDSTQTLSVGSVLIATVTFGATFALPGGYIADDHTDGGTPTLARSYAFLAFMMANTLAFICSSMATVGLMYSGSPMVHLGSRIKYIDISIYFTLSSITSLTAAFALALYTVLAPVAPKTAIAICIFGSLVIVYSAAEFTLKAAYLVGAFWVRKGPTWTLIRTMAAAVVSCIFFCWPLIVVFSWAAYQSKHPMRAFP